MVGADNFLCCERSRTGYLFLLHALRTGVYWDFDLKMKIFCPTGN